MIRAAICDSGKKERGALRAMLEKYQPPLDVVEYDSADALLWDAEAGEARYDLYFLDAGFASAAKRLQELDEDASIIFLSAEELPAGIQAVGSLARPVGEPALGKMLERAAERLRRKKRQSVAIASRGVTHVLRFKDIEYISSTNHILRFHLRSGEERTCYGQLDKVVSQLDPELFVRCHQSHIVNLSCVTAHTTRAFHVPGGVIPISRSYAVQAKRALDQYLFQISAAQ